MVGVAGILQCGRRGQRHFKSGSAHGTRNCGPGPSRIPIRTPATSGAHLALGRGGGGGISMQSVVRPVSARPCGDSRGGVLQGRWAGTLDPEGRRGGGAARCWRPRWSVSREEDSLILRDPLALGGEWAPAGDGAGAGKEAGEMVQGDCGAAVDGLVGKNLSCGSTLDGTPLAPRVTHLPVRNLFQWRSW